MQYIWSKWCVGARVVNPREVTDLLGQELVQTRPEDTDEAAIMGTLWLVIGLLLLLSAWFAWRYWWLLTAVLAGLGLRLTYTGAVLLKDLPRRLRNNRRNLTIHYGLTEVTVIDAGEKRVLALEECDQHDLWENVLQPLRQLLRMRAQLADLPADSTVRIAFEFAAFHTRKREWGERSFVVVPADGPPRVLADDALGPDDDPGEGLPGQWIRTRCASDIRWVPILERDRRETRDD